MPDLATRSERLKAEAKKLGDRDTLDFRTDHGEQVVCAVLGARAWRSDPRTARVAP